jgi:hypothetical protein
MAADIILENGAVQITGGNLFGTIASFSGGINVGAPTTAAGSQYQMTVVGTEIVQTTFLLEPNPTEAQGPPTPLPIQTTPVFATLAQLLADVAALKAKVGV